MNNIKQTTYKFLRKSQKYTGTDNVYLIKGGFWLTLAKIVSSATAFLIAIAFANLLDPVVYGNYKYILSLVNLLGIFSLIGMKTAVAQAVARGLEGSFYTGFKTKFKWALLGSLVAVCGAVYYWLHGNEILPIPLLISALFLPLMEASRIYAAFLGGKKLFDVQTKYGIYSQIISTITIIAVLVTTRNLFWLIAAYFVSHTFSNIAFFLITKIKYKPNKQEDKKTIGYAKHLSFIEVISQLSSYLDKILLFTLVGSAQLAIYSFAVLVPEQIKGVTENINTLAFPKLAQKSKEEIKLTITKKLFKIGLLAAAIAVIYIIAAPYIYKIFFPKYLAAVPYTQVFILSMVSLPTSLLGTFFQAKMMKKEIYSLKLTVHTARIVLFLILIPTYGIWGVIAATVGTELISAGVTLFLFKKA